MSVTAATVTDEQIIALYREASATADRVMQRDACAALFDGSRDARERCAAAINARSEVQS